MPLFCSSTTFMLKVRRAAVKTWKCFAFNAFVSSSMRYISCGFTADDNNKSKSCPFDALGISNNGDMTTVKAAYRSKCQTEHPDVGGTEEGFRRIRWAYESCCEKLVKTVPRSNSEFDGSSHDSSSKQKDDEGDYTHSYYRYKSKDERYHEQRQMFYYLFSSAEARNDIDNLLSKALRSHCFDAIDVSEPLRLSLRNYHRVTGYGEHHLTSCFAAMEHWEEYTQRRADVTQYHIMLILYTDGPKPGLTAQLISEGVEAIMEQMCVKGIEYDDWSLTLAHKAYRVCPYPST
ncbi:chaperone protein DNAj [Trypanosoma brucei equiperdum]|uniref:Chaperone protein DNAj n=1 Tax=Trypanosoma brucei equiperdum TaxID=630700 RepID=A0A3L6L7A5_9TRYP|nr:chaperone protein DNAj [Trypanosoma brucei equiperdum]